MPTLILTELVTELVSPGGSPPGSTSNPGEILQTISLSESVLESMLSARDSKGFNTPRIGSETRVIEILFDWIQAKQGYKANCSLGGEL
jgi:hypothetical protein